MSKLLPILLLLIGLGAGAGAGFVLRPGADADPGMIQDAHGGAADGHGDAQDAEHGGDGHGGDSIDPNAAADATGYYAPESGNTETVRLPNQFVVPLIQDGQVQAMVVIGLALDLESGHDFQLSRNEPRLRAIFLQLLFDYANIGGFEGVFTSGESLLALRRILRDAARAEIGPEVHDVLITELMRQES